MTGTRDRQARRIARSRDVPLVATLHATEWGRHAGRLDTDLSRHVHAAERSLATGADRLVVCSAAMAAEVRTQFGVDATVVRNGVIAAPAPGAEPSAGSAPVLVAAGRLEWEKGFSTLLRALPAVLDAHPRTRLVLAGRGSYEPTLRALAESLHVAPAVDFVGWLDAAALARTFGAATAVVVPSRYEPSGLVALEAIAARAPSW
jgi:glycogen(starch) synthase